MISPPTRLATSVERMMTSRVVLVLDRIPMSEVQTLTSQHDYNGFPVVTAEGRLTGMITKGDVLRALRASLTEPAVWGEPVSRWMAKGILALRPKETADTALAAMVESGLRSLPVIDEASRVVGIVSRNDLIAALTGRVGA